jgi:large subunit ribosomal protein L9
MMKVILLANVSGTGKKDQIVEVSDGYARNYLLPRKLAREATAAAVNAIQQAKSAADHKEGMRRKGAQEKADFLRKKEIVVTARCGEKGRLYGSITTQEIADALNAQHHVQVDKRHVELSGSVHTVGEYEASVWLYAGITVPMKVIVKPEA